MRACQHVSINCFCVLLACVSAFAWPARGEPASDVLAPLVTTPIAPPSPVLGADNKIHLAYEFTLTNMASSGATIDKVEALDAVSGAVLATLDGNALTQMLRLNGDLKGPAIPSGGSGFLFMDVALDKDAVVPKALKHRFEIAVAAAPATSDGGDHDPAPAPAQEVTFVTDPLEVGPAAVAVAPPLKGKHWVVGGGCCTPYTYHRGATLPINGAVRVAERFAIDFVQLNAEDAIASGPKEDLSSYAYFGDEIYAAAGGTVVETADDYPEQVPGKLPEGATMQIAAGNHVVVDIGGGRFTFYAHMQPGSVRVKVGDKVGAGDVLGLLGNSGNTDAPHLHFHVMDGPSPLLANGLPYVFSDFTVEGTVGDEKALFAGDAVTIDKGATSGAHRDALPLNLDVVSFP